MKIRTTVNITKFCYIQMTKIANQKNIKISKLLNDVLKKVIIDNAGNSDVSLFKTAKYQQKGGKYKVCHVRLDPEIYEAASDLRRLHKVSVSAILSDAISRLIDSAKQCVSKFLSFIQLDNYTILYNIIPRIIDLNTSYWTISRVIEKT